MCILFRSINFSQYVFKKYQTKVSCFPVQASSLPFMSSILTRIFFSPIFISISKNQYDHRCVKNPSFVVSNDDNKLVSLVVPPPQPLPPVYSSPTISNFFDYIIIALFGEHHVQKKKKIKENTSSPINSPIKSRSYTQLINFLFFAVSSLAACLIIFVVSVRPVVCTSFSVEVIYIYLPA